MTEQLVSTVLFVVTAMKTKIRLTKEEENYYFSLELISATSTANFSTFLHIKQ